MMKKLIAALAIFASLSAFAGTSVVWVRGDSASEVQAKLERKVDEINRTGRGVNGCHNPRVYAATAPKMSYRVDRFGNLEETWSATIKVSCSGR